MLACSTLIEPSAEAALSRLARLLRGGGRAPGA
jgi:hypothetical protein